MTTFSNFINSMTQSIKDNNALLNDTQAAIVTSGVGSAQACIYSLFLVNGKSENNFASGVVEFHKLYPDFKVLNLKDFKDIKAGLLLRGLAPRTIDNYKSRFNKLLGALDRGLIKANDAVKLSHAGIAELVTGTPKLPTPKVFNADTIVIKGVSVTLLAQALGVDPKVIACTLTNLADQVLNGVDVKTTSDKAVEAAKLDDVNLDSGVNKVNIAVGLNGVTNNGAKYLEVPTAGQKPKKAKAVAVAA